MHKAHRRYRTDVGKKGLSPHTHAKKKKNNNNKEDDDMNRNRKTVRKFLLWRSMEHFAAKHNIPKTGLRSNEGLTHGSKEVTK